MTKEEKKRIEDYFGIDEILVCPELMEKWTIWDYYNYIIKNRELRNENRKRKY